MCFHIYIIYIDIYVGSNGGNSSRSISLRYIGRFSSLILFFDFTPIDCDSLELDLTIGDTQDFEEWIRYYCFSINEPEITFSFIHGNLNKDNKIALYCHSGIRSMNVADFLLSKGFQSLANLQGGIDAWALEIDTTVERY